MQRGFKIDDYFVGENTIYLFFLLCAGKGEAAHYLAECFMRDMGVRVNPETKEFFELLTLVIGRNLGDEESVNGLADDAIPPEIERCGASCASLIKHNQEEIAQLIADHKFLTLQDVVGYAKELDYLVRNIAHKSYIDCMRDGEGAEYKDLIPCVDLLDQDGNVIMMGEVIVPEACCTIM